MFAYDEDGKDRLISAYRLTRPVRPDPEPVCKGFVWIGQPITSCDNCGRPAWDHDHLQTLDRAAGPFSPKWVYKPWAAELVEDWHATGRIIPERYEHLLALAKKEAQ